MAKLTKIAKPLNWPLLVILSASCASQPELTEYNPTGQVVEKVVFRDRVVSDPDLEAENNRLRKQREEEVQAAEARLAELERQLSAQTTTSKSIVKKTSLVEKGPRNALIFGNSSYISAPLRNPENDAKDLANALTQIGFEVELHTNASYREMGKAISRFGTKLKEGGVGLFYYAGHGMQVEGDNYLIPVDADPQEEEDLKYEAINVGSILSKMESAENDLNIVIMDACRNNPFARSWRSATRGLGRVEAPTGSVIIYATAPGKVAFDGNGSNGTFTKHLLLAIQKPNTPLLESIRQVRIGVMADTDNKQVPWVSEATTKEFYFFPSD